MKRTPARIIWDELRKNSMKKIGILLFALSVFTASPALAVDGRTLMRYCEIALESEDRPVSMHLMEDFNICVSKVKTVFDTIAEFERISDDVDAHFPFCLPDTVNFIEKIRLVYNYLKEHPAELYSSDVKLIIAAIGTAFPCPESTSAQ